MRLDIRQSRRLGFVGVLEDDCPVFDLDILQNHLGPRRDAWRRQGKDGWLRHALDKRQNRACQLHGKNTDFAGQIGCEFGIHPEAVDRHHGLVGLAARNGHILESHGWKGQEARGSSP